MCIKTNDRTLNIRLEWRRWGVGQCVGFIPRLKARVFSLFFIRDGDKHEANGCGR